MNKIVEQFHLLVLLLLLILLCIIYSLLYVSIQTAIYIEISFFKTCQFFNYINNKTNNRFL